MEVRSARSCRGKRRRGRGQGCLSQKDDLRFGEDEGGVVVVVDGGGTTMRELGQ